MKKLVISMLVTGLALCPLAWADIAPTLGSQPPALQLSTPDGKALSLQNYLGAKKVVLTFFASWSKSCQAELTDLQALSAGKRPSFEVLAVSFDKKAKDLKAFIARNNLSFPVLHDRKLSSVDAYQILIIPTTFCISRDGLIDRIFVDYDDNVKKAIAEWLAR